MTRNNLNFAVTSMLMAFCAAGPAQSKEQFFDRVFWADGFNSVCRQQLYSNPETMEYLVLAGKTATSVCACASDLMAVQLTQAEVLYFEKNKAPSAITLAKFNQAKLMCARM